MLDATVGEGVMEVLMMMNGDMQEDISAPALWEKGTGVLCRASVGVDALRRVPVQVRLLRNLACVCVLKIVPFFRAVLCESRASLVDLIIVACGATDAT